MNRLFQILKDKDSFLTDNETLIYIKNNELITLCNDGKKLTISEINLEIVDQVIECYNCEFYHKNLKNQQFKRTCDDCTDYSNFREYKEESY